MHIFAIPKRCGSSAWLEYMPVTHGVAGSSPVRTAKATFSGCFFYFISYIKTKNHQLQHLRDKSIPKATGMLLFSCKQNILLLKRIR